MTQSAGKIVKPIHAREGEFVDIHWHGLDGKTLVERRTCPPKATRVVRQYESGQTAASLDAVGSPAAGGLGKATTETAAPSGPVKET